MANTDSLGQFEQLVLSAVLTRPPRLIEAIAEVLIPYALREAVMGDFAEDYESLPLPQWMRHIARIAYRMVVNQVRSTINWRHWRLETPVLVHQTMLT